MGPGNPLAATLFAFLLSATNLPIIYMGLLDGRAYTWRGITGSLLVDATVSAAACFFFGLGLLFLSRHTSGKAGLASSLVA